MRARRAGVLATGMIAAALVAVAVGAYGADAAARSSPLAARLNALEDKVQRQQDALDVQNLMSRRAYYHSNGRNDLEYALFAHRPDISFGSNQGYWVGPDMKASYVEYHAAQQRRDLEWMHKLDPSVPVDDAHLGVGSFVMHTLTTPLIVIAGDGRTAKAMWYTVGALAGVDDDTKFKGHWMWEKYAVDFVREDGVWKFWHVLVVTDFGAEFGEHLGLSGPMQAAQQSGIEAGSAPKLDRQPVPAATVLNSSYHEWAPGVVHDGSFPKVPEPYQTFSDTFSYGAPVVTIPSAKP